MNKTLKKNRRVKENRRRTKMIRGRKALGVGQAFMFIVAIVTFALIMIFGYKAINDFLQRSQQVQFYQFKTDLEGSLQKLYTDYGAVRQERFPLPSRYEQICFVDMDAAYDASLCRQDAVACSVWENAAGYEAVDENVFLSPVAPVKIKVQRIETIGGYLCIPITGGSFELVLEGMGDRVRISLPD